MVSREQALKQLIQPGSSRPHQKDKICIVQATGSQERSLTYAEFEGLVADAIVRYKQLGLTKGQLVVLVSENSAELGAALIACWALNLIAVPVDFRITLPELGNIVKQLNAAALLGSQNVVPDFKSAVASVVGDSVAKIELSDLSSKGAAVEIDPQTIDGNAPAFIILTSGTTGMPKGAVHTMESLLINIIDLAVLAGIDDTMCGVLPLPLSHIFGLEVFNIAVSYGMKVVFSALTPASFVACVSKYKPHVTAGVPTLYGALMAAPKEALDLSNGRLLLCGGAPLPVSLAEEFEQKFGKRINNGYGSTESMIVALNQTAPIESVGKIVESAKIDIVNQDGAVLPEPEVGEIRISGPMLMKGYLNQPELTEKVLRDGNYYTGDMGYFKDGNLYIAGRSKEMIIVAGYKVFPAEVEDALRRHPLVSEVAVIGQPHRQLGQIVKAYVVLVAGEHSDKLEAGTDSSKQARQTVMGELKGYCKDNLRREMRPMEWEFQPSSRPLPKTGTGKIDKKQLEMAAV